MAPRAVACVVVVAIAGSACGGTTKRATTAPPRAAADAGPGARTLDAPAARWLRRTRRSPASPRRSCSPTGASGAAPTGSPSSPPKQPMTPRTSMPLDSVTKMATAALALRYAEEGRLGLDDRSALVSGVERRPARDRARPPRPLAGTREPAMPSTCGSVSHPNATVTPRQSIAAARGPAPHARGRLLEHGLHHRGADPPAGGRQPVAAGMRHELFDHPGGAGLALQPTELAHPPRAYSYWYPHGPGNRPVAVNRGGALLPRAHGPARPGPPARWPATCHRSPAGATSCSAATS